MKGRRLLFFISLVLTAVFIAACGAPSSDVTEIEGNNDVEQPLDINGDLPARPDIDSEAQIVYVKAEAGGAADGSSWSNAFGDLQEALDATGGEDTFQIWVAAGTYLPTMDHTGDYSPMDPRTKTFQLKNNVAIYGGFPADADDGTDLSDRDPEKHQTILSGDLNGNGRRDDGDAYHVFYHPAGLMLDGTAILDGVFISGGYANGPDIHSYGGGMLTVGLHDQHSMPTLVDVVITGNEAAEAGGGMHNIDGSPRLFGVSITRNQALLGGGISNVRSSPDLRDSILRGNDANTGGGMYSTEASYPTLTNSQVTDNTAGYGGGIASDGQSLATLTNVTITGNQADMLGGGIYAEDNSAPTLENVVVSGNRAEHTGGGLFFGASFATLTNVLISGNEAAEGAGMLLRDSFPLIVNTTITGNHARGYGGGIAATAGEPTGRITQGPFQIRNTIIWGNTAAEGFDNVYNMTPHAAPDFAHSLVQGSGGSTAWDSSEHQWGAPSFGTDGGNNLDADPRFVRPAVEPAPTAQGDYRLSPGSPAIDAGSAEFLDEGITGALDGTNRITGGAPDLGAYEFNPEG